MANKKPRIKVTDELLKFPRELGNEDFNTSFMYYLTDPETDEVRYVGQAMCPRNRYITHCNPNEHEGNQAKHKWIASLVSKGLKPIMHVFERCNLREANKREKQLIGEFAEAGHPLVNKRGTR